MDFFFLVSPSGFQDFALANSDPTRAAHLAWWMSLPVEIFCIHMNSNPRPYLNDIKPLTTWTNPHLCEIITIRDEYLVDLVKTKPTESGF